MNTETNTRFHRDANSLPLVTVVVPTYKDTSRLISCIHSINRQSYPASLIEIIVVNNDEGELKGLESKRVKMFVLRELKAGSYAARNAGIRKASGEIIAFTDSDCIPHFRWIECGVSTFLQREQVMRVSGSIDVLICSEATWLARSYEAIFAFPQQRQAKRGTGVTANLFVRKSVFTNVGLFNEDAKSGEDLQWGLRAAQSGYSLYFTKECRVSHPSRSNMRELMRKVRRTYGGWWTTRGWLQRSLILRLALVVYCLRPPVRPILTIVRRSDVTGSTKIGALIALFILRFGLVAEHFKIAITRQVARY